MLTWSPQSCWHSFSVRTFSWNTFRLYYIWQNYCMVWLGAAFVYQNGCLYPRYCKYKSCCIMYTYTVKLCGTVCTFWHLLVHFAHMCADISTVLSDDGECGFGRRNLPLGNSLQNRCFPSLRLELKFHAFNQKGADFFVSSHSRSRFVPASWLQFAQKWWYAQRSGTLPHLWWQE